MKNRIGILYLNEEEMIKAGVENMSSCLKSMEDMFITLDEEDYRMAGKGANEHGALMKFPKNSNIMGMPLDAPDYRFGALPAYLGGRFHIVGIKTYGSNCENKNIGLPRSILMMQLLDANTGIPFTYMSANILSAMRTGAVAGLGAKYLYKGTPKTIGIIGPGVINHYALKAILEVYNTVDTLKVNGLSNESSNDFINNALLDYSFIKEGICCESIEEACKDSDIIIFCTTNAKNYEDNPRIEKDWIKDNCLIISMSALQVPITLLSDSDTILVADNYKMYEDWGKGSEYPTQKTVSTLLGMGFYDAVSRGYVPRSHIVNIGEVIIGEKTIDKNKTVIFAVGGLPTEDTAWAYDCYQKAKELELGTILYL